MGSERKTIAKKGEVGGEDLLMIYKKISAMLFDGGLQLNDVEAVVLTIVDEMGTRKMISKEQAQELEDLIKEVIADPQYPSVIDGTYEVKE